MSLPRGSVVQFRESRYIIGQDRTSESKVVALWICLALWCLISSISIYYAPELDIRVKSFDHMSFRELPGLIWSISIYYAPQSQIRVKSYDHLNFSRASVVQFRGSQYITGLNRAFEPKFFAVWICLVLWCLISSMSIYYTPLSDIWEKSYDHLNFLRASAVHFLASRYIMGLPHTPESGS